MEWRIFFIGPMVTGGPGAQPFAKNGRASEPADHFSQMVAAVLAELQEKGYQPVSTGEHTLTGGKTVASLVLTRGQGEDLDHITLIQPHELFSANKIVTNVFDAIDDADLVIADLSGVRPAVVYELAFAHALGIWTILLSPGADAELMFYLRAYRHAVVNFGEQDIRTDEFTTAFQAWLRERSKRFDSGNPFTDFYDGAPLPDISAAAGLANGYYDNFLKRVLSSQAKLVDYRDGARAEGRAIAGVLVVRPPRLRGLPQLIKDTGEDLEQVFGDRFRRGERGKVYVDTGGFGDRTCEFMVDEWLIDVPRTVLTLERSPRLKRKRGEGEERQRARDNVSEVLITRFLEGARQALDAEDDILDKEERFYYGTPVQIIRFLQLSPKERVEAGLSVWPTEA